MDAGMECMICLHRDNRSERALGVIEGTSLCRKHQIDVIDGAPYLWYHADGSLHVAATIKNAP